MNLLLDTYALALAAAAALGLVVGFADRPRGEERRAGSAWPALLVLLAVPPAAAAWLLVAGRAGLWLETGLLMSGAYLAGCAVGCLARRLAG